MNNLESIRDFVDNDIKTKLLINQVSDEIGLFYLHIIEKYALEKNIKLIYQDKLIKEEPNNLFVDKIINVCFSNSKKNIEGFLKSNNKCFILTDYKNYKEYSKSSNSVNGYNYQKDIEYYLKKIMKVNNSTIIDLCLSSPYLIYSELSKYLINQTNNFKENKIKENNNFIFDIRKDIYKLKRSQGGIKKIYNKFKEEVKYKKFNFLTL